MDEEAQRKYRHDVRNKLAVVYSHAQVLQLLLEKSKDKDIQETLKALIDSVEDANSLLR